MAVIWSFSASDLQHSLFLRSDYFLLFWWLGSVQGKIWCLLSALLNTFLRGLNLGDSDVRITLLLESGKEVPELAPFFVGSFVGPLFFIRILQQFQNILILILSMPDNFRSCLTEIQDGLMETGWTTFVPRLPTVHFRVKSKSLIKLRVVVGLIVPAFAHSNLIFFICLLILSNN